MFMHILGERDENIAAMYTSPQMAFLSSFGMMLGSFEIAHFTSDTTGGESVAVFVLFMIFVQLVLLNMLIAIMSGSVESVKVQQQAAGLFTRAGLVQECRELLLTDGDLLDPYLFPTFFTLRMPKMKPLSVSAKRLKRMPKVQQMVEYKVDLLEERVSEAITAAEGTDLRLSGQLEALEMKLHRVQQEQARQRTETNRRLDTLVALLRRGDGGGGDQAAEAQPEQPEPAASSAYNNTPQPIDVRLDEPQAASPSPSSSPAGTSLASSSSSYLAGSVPPMASHRRMTVPSPPPSPADKKKTGCSASVARCRHRQVIGATTSRSPSSSSGASAPAAAAGGSGGRAATSLGRAWADAAAVDMVRRETASITAEFRRRAERTNSAGIAAGLKRTAVAPQMTRVDEID